MGQGWGRTQALGINRAPNDGSSDACGPAVCHASLLQGEDAQVLSAAVAAGHGFGHHGLGLRWLLLLLLLKGWEGDACLGKTRRHGPGLGLLPRAQTDGCKRGTYGHREASGGLAAALGRGGRGTSKYM